MTKLCVNCKHYVLGNVIKFQEKVLFTTHECHHPKNIGVNPVTGEKELIYEHCSTLRIPDLPFGSICSDKGKWFELK